MRSWVGLDENNGVTSTVVGPGSSRWVEVAIPVLVPEREAQKRAKFFVALLVQASAAG